MRRSWIWIGLSGLVVLILGAAAVFYPRPYTFRGARINPPTPAADFSLQDASGNTFQLSEQRGKVVLLFFGYTNCPDACPATMSVFKQVYTRLGSNAKNVDFVFITVDPRRDKPEVASQYAHSFNPAFIGLSGTEQDLTPIWKAYGVSRSVPANPSGSSYEVQHSTYVYVIDREGNWQELFSLGASAEDIYQDVSYLIRAK